MISFLQIAILFGLTASMQELSDIRYHFTTCGASGRNGPTISQCMNWYRQQNSPIARDDRLFRFLSDDIRIFPGSQGFRVSKTGFYNVTVAGAAGGRGICSTGRGKGLLWKGIVKLRASQDLLVLVGQRGDEPCDVQKDIPVCASPPKNIDEGTKCFDEWDNWLISNPTLSQNAASTTLNFGGGGGGGGASMIRVRDRQTAQFSDLPIIIAGGGGGSAANMSEFIPEVINVTFPADVPSNATMNELYMEFINAKNTDRDTTLEHVYNFTGIRGYISNSVNIVNNRPGAGCGYFPAVSLQQDGSPLSVAENFATGGIDCLHLSTDLSQRPLIENVHGGFGGGGGQCESGGSGGGFTGGSVFSNKFFGIPGNGGFYNYFSQQQNEVVELSTELNLEELNGYVEIIPTECGCGYKCIFEEMEKFRCDCPINTTLAPNQYDCYEGITVDVTEYTYGNVTKDLLIRFVPFNKSVEIFSLYSMMTLTEIPSISVNSSSSQPPMCTLLFINETGNVVITSNTVRTQNGEASKLSPTTNLSNPVLKDFLYSPSSISGVVFVSNRLCSTEFMQLNISVKLEDPEAVNISVDFEQVVEVASTIQNMIQYRINDDHPSITPTGNLMITPQIFLIIPLTLTGAVLLLLAIVIPGLVCFKIRRRKKLNKVNAPARNFYTSVTDNSMVNNLLYNGVRHSVSSESTSQKIVPEDREAELNDSIRSFTPRFGISVPDLNFNKLREKNEDWEYSRSRLVYMKEIGEGHFGKVLLMKAHGIAGYNSKIPVAVKTLSSTKPKVVKQFTEEANLMKELSHPNIITLLGTSFEDVDQDNAPLMILEYMPYGDLNGFLRKYRPVIASGLNSIEIHHFYSFATDVANGLAFLSSLNYIHGDIASRNCLVGPSLNIKISDFGLTKKLEDGATEYKIEGSAVLPLRWLSPESLVFGKFTVASDIWSYGVLLWEIVTYGDIPLKDVSNTLIADMAEKRILKHTRPPNCPDDIYDIMTECHQHSPQSRISVSDILARLTSHPPEDM